MSLAPLLPLTPLQSLLGFDYLPHRYHGAIELLFAFVCFAAAIAIRRRRLLITSSAFMMLGLGAFIDLLAGSAIANPNVANLLAGLAVLLFFWGAVRTLTDAVAHRSRRIRRDESNIVRDLIRLALYAAVLVIVLAADFQVNVYSLVASVGVLGVVIGFAVQQTLGDIFSGVALHLQRPFNNGDWVRSGLFLGKVQSIGVRSTTVITRANERLEIPNSSIAKEVLTNYGSPPVCDEVTIGISYIEPPNRVREAILKVMRDVPHVLSEPSPEVLAWEYGESAIKYRIKFWIPDYALQEEIRNALVTSLWYALRRNAMEIPYPIQTIEVRRPRISRRPQDEFEREIINELRQIDFLRELSETEVRLLVPNVQAHEFGAGETIFTQGDTGDSMYVIRRGSVEVLGRTENGKTRRIAILNRPGIIGEGAMMTGEARNATCKAHTDTEVLELNRESFAELFKQHPEAVVQISEVIANRASERKEVLKETGHDGVTERRNWWISKVREIFDL
ncbi:MAG TPA: mechanosensitive ion channel family protein [Candidatus Binataceae bacterium]|nr:mechanosensitive ion channel family protein [Candidatus Binataceae bacterium]